MKKFSPPQMKEVSFPTPYTPHPTPCPQENLFRQTPATVLQLPPGP
ncbi:MAG: hypothetical protein O9295_22210 [Microcystis sp. LE18-22.4A]|nr:hypothetical protein [Microcystis sp. LE18-22.4A]